MLSKYFLLVSLISFIGLSAFAQKQNIYFLKNNGKEVSTKDSADFMRVISEPSSGTNLYDLKEYYLTGIAKRIGQVSTVAPLKFEGQCIIYFASGARRNVLFYKNGIATGDMFEYFPNGKLYCAKNFSGKPDDPYIITSCNDSLGKSLVTDGNGYGVLYTPDFKHVELEGEIKNGLKTGEWKVRPVFVDEPLQVIETYSRGKLISGKSIDTAGRVVTYQFRIFPPTYKNGEKAFYQFVAANVHRGLLTRKSNLRAVISTNFIVEKDGSLSDIKLIKSVSEDLDNEALRLITFSAKNWQPAVYYGRPAKAGIVQSINFVLLLRMVNGVN